MIIRVPIEFTNRDFFFEPNRYEGEKRPINHPIEVRKLRQEIARQIRQSKGNGAKQGFEINPLRPTKGLEPYSYNTKPLTVRLPLEGERTVEINLSYKFKRIRNYTDTADDIRRRRAEQWYQDKWNGSIEEKWLRLDICRQEKDFSVNMGEDFDWFLDQIIEEVINPKPNCTLKLLAKMLKDDERSVVANALYCTYNVIQRPHIIDFAKNFVVGWDDREGMKFDLNRYEPFPQFQNAVYELHSVSGDVFASALDELGLNVDGYRLRINLADRLLKMKAQAAIRWKAWDDVIRNLGYTLYTLMETYKIDLVDLDKTNRQLDFIYNV